MGGEGWDGCNKSGRGRGIVGKEKMDWHYIIINYRGGGTKIRCVCSHLVWARGMPLQRGWDTNQTRALCSHLVWARGMPLQIPPHRIS